MSLEFGPWEVVEPVIVRSVERVVREGALPHPIVREWAERWLSGEDRSEDGAYRACWAVGKAHAESRGMTLSEVASQAASRFEQEATEETILAACATKAAREAARVLNNKLTMKERRNSAALAMAYAERALGRSECAQQVEDYVNLLDETEQ